MRRVVLISLNKGKGVYTTDDGYFVVSDNKDFIAETVKSVNSQLPNIENGNVVLTADHIYETGSRVWLTPEQQSFLNVAPFLMPLPKISSLLTGSVTGVNVLTPIAHFVIPPLIGCNKLNIYFYGLKESSSGTGTLRFFIHTDNDFSSSSKVQIAVSNLTGVQWFYMERSFDILTSTMEGFRFDAASSTDKVNGNIVRNSTPYNNAVPLHFWVAVIPNSTSEIHYPKSIIIEQIKEKNTF